MTHGRLLVVVLLGVALVAACNNTDDVEASAAVEPPSAKNVPDDPKTTTNVCVAYTPPVEGTDCTVQLGLPKRGPWDQTCEYGHDIARVCNDVFDCDGSWTRRKRNACAGRCPDTIEAIVPGEACQTKPFRDVPEVACSYFEGTCACVADAPDGGSSSSGSGGTVSRPGHWRCAPPPRNGCPAQRPPLGSECVREMTCDYGTCALERDLNFACSGRVWIQIDSVQTCP